MNSNNTSGEYMKSINTKVLPKNIVDVLQESELHSDDVKLLIGALTTGNRARRIIICALYNSPHLWQQSDGQGKRANAKDFKVFLESKGVVVDPTELCRSLKSGEIEQQLGVGIGTCSIGGLRPLMPLLNKKDSRYIAEVWAAAEELAGGSKVKARHVEEVLAQEQYSGVGKKKTKKPLAIANNQENRKQYRKQLEELSKKLTALELADLVKRAKKFAA